MTPLTCCWSVRGLVLGTPISFFSKRGGWCSSNNQLHLLLLTSCMSLPLSFSPTIPCIKHNNLLYALVLIFSFNHIWMILTGPYIYGDHPLSLIKVMCCVNWELRIIEAHVSNKTRYWSLHPSDLKSFLSITEFLWFWWMAKPWRSFFSGSFLEDTQIWIDLCSYIMGLFHFQL